MRRGCFFEDGVLYCRAWNDRLYRYGGYGVGWIAVKEGGYEIVKRKDDDEKRRD